MCDLEANRNDPCSDTIEDTIEKVFIKQEKRENVGQKIKTENSDDEETSQIRDLQIFLDQTEPEVKVEESEAVNGYDQMHYFNYAEWKLKNEESHINEGEFETNEISTQDRLASDHILLDSADDSRIRQTVEINSDNSNGTTHGKKPHYSDDPIIAMDNPVHDIICSLHETPFNRLSDDDQRDVINKGRPTPPLNILKRDHKQGHNFSRSFNTQWYDSHKWLCGSHFKQGLFCWPCLLFAKGKNNVWVSQGFSDFKNLSASIKKHEGSKDHISSYLSLKRLEMSTSTIRSALEIQSPLSLKLYNKEVKKNRKLLGYLIDVTCLLARQNLSCRGHDGTFREIFNLFIKRDIEIQEHLKKMGNIFSDLSKTIENDLLICMSEYLMEKIHTEIKEALCFAMQADDTTTAILEKSQCAISVRYINKFGEIKERFLGFHEVSEDRTADAMCGLITSVLSPFNFKDKLVGQCYDGASVMASSLNGLQKKIKVDSPTALLTHSSAHRLSLVLQNGLNNITNCRIYFACATSIPDFFHQSAKRTFILDSVMRKRIPSPSETRWISRSKVIHVLECHWEVVKTVFQQIMDDKSSADDSISGASRFLKFMNDLEFAFLTMVYKDIFDILTDLLVDMLEKKSLDISYCKREVFLARDRIKALRNEAAFDELFEKAKMKIFNSDFQSPLSKRIKLSDTIKDDERASLRMLFYEIIDNIIMQIEVRFADMSQLLYFSLVNPSKFKEYRKEIPVNLINNLTSFYKTFFNKQRLINELGVIYHDEQFEKLNIESMIKMFLNNDYCEIFPEVYKLCVLISTIPATTTSSENLKRIKTYSRNSTTNDRFLSRALIAIEEELFRSLQESEDFIEIIINKFSLLKDRRINLIYKK